MEERLHLKGLNGLRAIAAISVVIAHMQFPWIRYKYIWPRDLGTYAVTLFFTLSGFLITYLLLAEKKKTTISIRNFYFRRILRIWPLYFAYLFIVVVIIYIQTPEKLPGLLPYYLFFAANVPNILTNTLPYLGHYWSLGVEEQFYIFWPWLIKRSANICKAILVFIAAFLVLRIIFRYLYLKYGFFLPINTTDHTRFDCMAIGGIGAYFCFKKNKLFLRLTVNKFIEIACWLCLCLMAVNKYYVTPFLNHDIISVVTLCLIVNLSFNDKAIINLENPFFDFLGRISYGIYIIHPLIIYGLKQVFDSFDIDPVWNSVFFCCAVMCITIGIAWLSYTFFEKRFLKLKDKYSVVKSSG